LTVYYDPASAKIDAGTGVIVKASSAE